MVFLQQTWDFPSQSWISPGCPQDHLAGPRSKAAAALAAAEKAVAAYQARPEKWHSLEEQLFRDFVLGWDFHPFFFFGILMYLIVVEGILDVLKSL